jgi:hypothetical protein
VYFCISAGAVLIAIGVFTFLSCEGDPRHHSRHFRYLGIICNILAGIGLTLLSLTVLTDAWTVLGETP